MKHFVAIMAMFFLLSACSSTTIYVVRHAEKAPPDATTGNDVNLSAAGQQRAIALKQTLQAENMAAVFATQFRRTQQTVKPLADAKTLPVIIYQANTGNALLDSLAQIKGKKYLVAGHSNTVPAMVRSLGLQTSFSGDIQENDYDNLFVIKISWGSKRSIRLTEKTYGAPSP